MHFLGITTTKEANKTSSQIEIKHEFQSTINERNQEQTNKPPMLVLLVATTPAQAAEQGMGATANGVVYHSFFVHGKRIGYISVYSCIG